ncbi:olfactory receptor 1L6-like [Hemicordylus capensis]|uniref:olfactory receptor 1L6-like n=1 Tax=Hemicordylus capensis TaxID=884348 RepID=UPI00230277C2|nr:olfactory receptor 1L6-like [Hemicordylus capensis]
MEKEQQNKTSLAGFILLGLSSSPKFQILLSPIFLLLYLLCLMGNLGIILLICSNSCLFYAPMYYFLSHLSLADVGFSTTIVPKMLQILLSQTDTISYSGCLTQIYFFVVFCTTDNFLLACMAYDRYVAICHPLHYSTIMSYRRCLLLAAGSWLWSHFRGLLYVLSLSNLSFCASREIPHFFCDLHPLLKLSCSDISAIEMLLVIEAPAAMLGPITLVVLSYMFILSKVLKVPSASGKYKAFSTCSSHLTTVALFYSTLFATYIRPTSSFSAPRSRVASVFYTLVIPTLNPFIYSLRNSEVQRAMRKFLRSLFQQR